MLSYNSVTEKEDKPGDNRLPVPQDDKKYCAVSLCARLYLSLSHLLSLFAPLCMVFSFLFLFTVTPNTFMITGGGRALFGLFSEAAVLHFPLPNPVKSSTCVSIEGFHFMVCPLYLKSFCQRLTRKFLLPKILEPPFLTGKESFFSFLLQNAFTVSVLKECWKSLFHIQWDFL